MCRTINTWKKPFFWHTLPMPWIAADLSDKVPRSLLKSMIGTAVESMENSEKL